MGHDLNEPFGITFALEPHFAIMSCYSLSNQVIKKCSTVLHKLQPMAAQCGVCYNAEFYITAIQNVHCCTVGQHAKM